MQNVAQIPHKLTDRAVKNAKPKPDGKQASYADCGGLRLIVSATGKCRRDPSADLRGALPPAKETHYPTITKPLEVGELLRALADYQGDYNTKLPYYPI